MFKQRTRCCTRDIQYYIGGCLCLCSIMSLAMIISDTGGAPSEAYSGSRDHRAIREETQQIGSRRSRLDIEERQWKAPGNDVLKRHYNVRTARNVEDTRRQHEDSDPRREPEDNVPHHERLKILSINASHRAAHAFVNEDGDEDYRNDYNDEDTEGSIAEVNRAASHESAHRHVQNASGRQTGRSGKGYDSGLYKSMHLLENKSRFGREINEVAQQNGSGIIRKYTLVTRNTGNGSPPEGVRRVNTNTVNLLGYRKDGVSYYADSESALKNERIETQIPIESGHATWWMLHEPPATQIQTPELPWQPGDTRSEGGVPLVVDKIYWSPEVENLVAKGITNDDYEQFLHKLQSTPVAEMHPPQWNRCGRPNNQYIVLNDGTALCARYRGEHVKLLHGELLSFSLSRILGLDNVPIVRLSEANTRGSQWHGMDISAAGWNESSIVALIQWIDGLDSERSRVKMPTAILDAYENGGVFLGDDQKMLSLSANNLTELVQWSDLILFDYLTGHYDRVASMQDGADREQRPSIMHENIRNLRQVWQTGKMWLIDNESGLFDGYELLYHGGEMGRKFVGFHRQMLATNCVFRRQTVRQIERLSRINRPDQIVISYTMAQDRLYDKLTARGVDMTLFKKYFAVRLKEVVDWIEKCRHR